MSAKRLVYKSAAAAMAATFLFGLPNAAAFAQDNLGVTIDFPARAIGDDVDWAAVAEAFGQEDPDSFKNPIGFVIGRVADGRGMSPKELVRDLNRGKRVQLDFEWLRNQAPIAGYTVNKTPAVGAVAYFAKGTQLDLTMGSDQYSMTFEQGSHYAYVSAVNGDGTLTLEDFAGSHRSYTVEASSVTDFLHLAQSTLPAMPAEPTAWLSDAAPSSPGVERDIATEPGFQPHYPVKDLGPTFGLPADADEATLDAKIRQCGTYAVWLVSHYLGISRDELGTRLNTRKDILGVTTKSGDAGRMDELYTDLGVRVDKTPAVGAIATWDPGDKLMGVEFGPTGHAAVVLRAYRLLASDKADADAIAAGRYVDGVTLQRLVDKASGSSAPKLTYVLLEDYNGFGGPSTYGQKLMPADWVKHYIHLASSPVVAPLTPSERLDRYVATRPKLAEVLGEPTGGADEVNGTEVTRTFANGALSYNSDTDTLSQQLTSTTQEQDAAIQAEAGDKDRKPSKTVPPPTPQERLAKQVTQIGDVLRAVTLKLTGRKQSPDLSAKIASLVQRLTRLQQELAALPAS